MIQKDESEVANVSDICWSKDGTVITIAYTDGYFIIGDHNGKKKGAWKFD